MRRSTSDELEAKLAAIELRLRGAPHEILGVPASASNSEACAAFVALSHELHASRIASRDLASRATLVYRRLRQALSELTSTPAIDRAVTRRIDRN